MSTETENADSKSYLDEIPDIDTVFLVGAGIDHNGWAPVLAAIDEFRPEAKVGTDYEAANYFFATHVYQRRFLEQLKHTPEVDITIAEQLISQWSEIDKNLKQGISKHLAEATASNQISLRDAFIATANEHSWGKRVFLTANWDMLLEKHDCPPGMVLHMHGSIEENDFLYLPSEVADEPYRTPSERELMAKRIGTMWQYIAKAPRIVIYGLSLSALDAELGSTLSVGLREHVDKNPCEVSIFNLGDQIEKVERRVKMFFDNKTNVHFKRHPLS